MADAVRFGKPGPHPLPVTLVEATDVVGVAIASSIVLFSRRGDVIEQAFTFDTPASSESHRLVTDLAPGTWEISSPGGQAATREVLASAQSCWLTGPAGSYRLAPSR